MYMADQSLPLPAFEEVLVCTASTTFEEVCHISLLANVTHTLLPFLVIYFHIYVGEFAMAQSFRRPRLQKVVLPGAC